MPKTAYLVLTGALLCVLLAGQAMASNAENPPEPADSQSGSKTGLKLETLLKTELEGAEGTEVIVSRVSIPAHTSLPKHWHPGEEFAYVLEGKVVLWQEGKEDIVGKTGDALKVPLKQVHTAMTGDEGAVILVFRVHEQGQPERVPVE